MTCRKGTTGLPRVPGGFSGGRRGWSAAHRSLGVRQIVGRHPFILLCVFRGDHLCYDEGAIIGHTKYSTDMLAV